MKTDMCVACGEGFINIRVGALIVKDGKVLMVESNRGYLYSVGGRIKMGETAQEAVVREVYEETGVKMNVRKLIAVQENYFYGDSPSKMGKQFYEIAFYFQMDVPKDFEPVSYTVTEGSVSENLVWVAPDSEKTLYPDFFREEIINPSKTVRYLLSDER